jgi:hypothetical protein
MHPHNNSGLYHLRTKFDLETLGQIGNTLFQNGVLSVLPVQVETVADPYLQLYYDNENGTEASITRKLCEDTPRYRRTTVYA